MDPPERLGSLEAAAPSAEDIGAPITPPINAPDVVLTVSFLNDNDTMWRWMHILVCASLTQHHSLCGIRRHFNNKNNRGVYFVRDPVVCTD